MQEQEQEEEQEQDDQGQVDGSYGEGDSDLGDIGPGACLFDGRVYVSAQQVK